MENLFIEQAEQQILSDFIDKYCTKNGVRLGYTKIQDDYIFGKNFAFTLEMMHEALEKDIEAACLLDYFIDRG